MTISLKKKNSIIVGGSGQFGISLANQLIKKKYNVVITTRNLKETKKKFNKHNKTIKIEKLDILKKKAIKNLIKKYKPYVIFYFAGQSSPNLSFKKPKETHLSNFVGCFNFLKIIKSYNLTCKFINANSCEIFAKSNKKITINSKKNL